MQKFIVREGSLWERSGNPEDLETIDSINKDLEKTATELSKLLIDFKLTIAVVSKAETRCFVYRGDQNKHHYILGINSGTFFNIKNWMNGTELFNSMLADSYIGINLNINLSKITEISTDLTVKALIYHEFAHIMRGHHGYINDAEDNNDKKERRKKCEIDADKWSAYVLVSDIHKHVRNLADNYGGDVYLISDCILEIMAASLYRCFSFYNQICTPETPYNPHPLIRATRISVGVGDNLLPTETFDLRALTRLQKILDGLSRAEAYVSTPMEQKDWDLAKIIELTNSENNLQNGFEKELVPFAPIKR